MNVNGAFIHLAVNHLPVVGTLFALGLLLVALWQRTLPFQRLALSSVIVVALTSLPAYFSGECAEEVIEKLPNVSRHLIHDHEEAAEAAFVAVLVAGCFSLGGLWLMRKGTVPRWLLPGALLSTLVAAGLMSRAAGLGGHIRHPEVRAAGSTADDDSSSH